MRITQLHQRLMHIPALCNEKREPLALASELEGKGYAATEAALILSKHKHRSIA